LPPVGNDVVDLKHPENQGKIRDDRFLGRVFTAEERGRIAVAARPETFLWALWAAKEAAFKVISRDDPTVRSTPRKYAILLDEGYEFRTVNGAGISAGPVVTVGNDLSRTSYSLKMSDTFLAGRAITPRGELALRIIVTDDYVHALSAATASDLDDIFQRVDRMDVGEDPGDASDFVRRQLLIEIACCLDCPLDELSIGKEPLGPGAPFVLRRGKPFAVDISLSHDGRFAAFTFMIRKNP
jgi:phosphopantetheinyl transferase (holo-ACP synthase)